MTDTRVIKTKEDVEAIKEEWYEFLGDWIDSYLTESGRMEADGWEDLFSRGERYLSLDLGDSTESPGYKHLLALSRAWKRENVE